MIQKRSVCRGGQPCEPENEAQAWHCLMQHSVPHLQELVGELAARYDIHVTAGMLYEWSNPYRVSEGRGAYVQARLAAPLTEITGNLVLFDYWERRLGRVAIALPKPGEGIHQETLVAGATAVREFSQALDAWSAGLADGRVSADELPTITREAYEAIAAIVSLVKIAERHVDARVHAFTKAGAR